jgi:hypothetical protein
MNNTPDNNPGHVLPLATVKDLWNTTDPLALFNTDRLNTSVRCVCLTDAHTCTQHAMRAPCRRPSQLTNNVPLHTPYTTIYTRQTRHRTNSFGVARWLRNDPDSRDEIMLRFKLNECVRCFL